MDTQRIDMYMMTNGKFFEGHHLPQVKNYLSNINESQWDQVQSIQLKDPTTMLIISILIGTLGIDRFMIGDTGLGIGKLLTCGGFGIWAIVDYFLIMGATKEKNLIKLQEALNMY